MKPQFTKLNEQPNTELNDQPNTELKHFKFKV